MKKKGLLAMGLAGVLTVGMCMPVFAADATNNEFTQGDKSTSQNTDVTITKPVSYSVTIPKTIILKEVGDTDIEVALAEGAVLEKDKGVTITLGGNNYAEASKELTLSAGAGVDIKSIITPPASNVITDPGSIKYTLAAPVTITKAGNYSGTIQFTVGYNGDL